MHAWHKLMGGPRHWDRAAEAAAALECYLDTEAPRRRYERRLPRGTYENKPLPVGILCHIVCAVRELGSVLEVARA